jgi:hypothetical protein
LDKICFQGRCVTPLQVCTNGDCTVVYQ